jgi:hypothetical protein
VELRQRNRRSRDQYTDHDSFGTSTVQVFTGQTVGNNGNAGARASAAVTVSSYALAWQSLPSTLSFTESASGIDRTLGSALPLQLTNGSAAGWSISATSTTFTTGRVSPTRCLPCRHRSVRTR